MLKEIMSEKGLRQVDLANLLDVSQKTISVKIRDDRWSVNEAKKIRDFLGLKTIDEIFLP